LNSPLGAFRQVRIQNRKIGFAVGASLIESLAPLAFLRDKLSKATKRIKTVLKRTLFKIIFFCFGVF